MKCPLHPRYETKPFCPDCRANKERAIQSLQGVELPPITSDSLWSERIKTLMQQAGLPDSQSVYSAMWQLANELQHDSIAYARTAVAAAMARGAVPKEPIDMVLYCPNCGKQHIDAPEPAVKTALDPNGVLGWPNPPHRSHLCHSCGCIWRPADVPTNGVATIKTQGKADTWFGGWSGSAVPATKPTQAEAAGEREAAIEEAFESARFALLRPNSRQSMAHIMDVLHCRVQDVFHQRVAALATQQADPVAFDTPELDAIGIKAPTPAEFAKRVYARGFADGQRAATQQAGQGEAVAEAEKLAWADRYDLKLGRSEAIAAFDDAATLRNTPPAPQQPEALAQQERDREDAERMDWLQKVARCEPKMDGNHVWWPLTWNQCQQIKGPTIRAAIDAARSSEGGGK